MDEQSRLVTQAFQELKMLHHLLGVQATPPSLLALAGKVHALIDGYIDRPAAEKDELKAFAVLALGAPYLFDDLRRFEESYSPNIARIVESFVSGQSNNDVAQVMMALDTAGLESTFEVMAASGPMEFTIPMEHMAMFEQALSRQSLDPSSRSAPRLMEYERSLYQQIVSTLEGPYTAQAKPAELKP